MKPDESFKRLETTRNALIAHFAKEWHAAKKAEKDKVHLGDLVAAWGATERAEKTLFELLDGLRTKWLTCPVPLYHAYQPDPWGCAWHSAYALTGDETLLEYVRDANPQRFAAHLAERGILQKDSYTTTCGPTPVSSNLLAPALETNRQLPPAHRLVRKQFRLSRPSRRRHRHE